jgi:hypothetical protein
MKKSPNHYQAGLCGLYSFHILPQNLPDIQETTSIKLKQPCKACGYRNGNLIKLWGDRFAIKCGGCDTYQGSIDLHKQRKGRVK